MGFTIQQFKDWVNNTFPDNVVRSIREGSFRDGLSKLADYVFETNSATYIQESLTQVQGLRNDTVSASNLIVENKMAVLAALARAETAALQAENKYEFKGFYNGNTNVPALTANSNIGQTGTKKQHYLVDVAGPAAFAGYNFAAGAVLNVGDELVALPNGTWGRIAKKDDAYQKTLVLEELIRNMYPTKGVMAGSVGTNGTFDTAARTISIDVGVSGYNTTLLELLYLADFPDWKAGDRLQLLYVLGESQANLFNNPALWIPMCGIVQYTNYPASGGDGVYVNPSGIIRKDPNEIYMVVEYVIPAGVTAIRPFFRVFTGNNNTGSKVTFTWKTLQVKVMATRDAANFTLNDSSRAYYEHRKMILKNSSDILSVGATANAGSAAAASSLNKVLALEKMDMGAFETITHGNTVTGVGSAANAGSAAAVYYNDPNGKVTFEGKLKELNVWVATAGSIYFSIGTPSPGVSFAPRKVLGPFAAAVGLNTFVVSEDVKKDEFIALGGGNGTAVPFYTGGGGPATNRFVSHSISTNVSTPSAWGTFFAYYFKVEGYPAASDLLRKMAKKDETVLKANIPALVTEEVSKPATTTTYRIGATGAGDSTDAGASSAAEIKYSNGASAFTAPGILEKIEGYFGGAGTAYFSIGSITDSKFVPRIVLGPFVAQVGFNSFNVSVPVATGEIMGLGGENGATAKIRFGQSGGVAGVTYYQKATYGPAGAGGGNNSYYALSGLVRCYPDRPFFHELTTRRQMGLSMEGLINDGVVSDVVTVYGTTTDYSDQFVTTAEAYFTNGDVFTADGNLTKISINSGAVANVNFAIGIIDQWGRAIIERTFYRYGLVGVNDFIVNERVKKGQVLFIKAPTATLRYKTGVAGKSLYQTTGYSGNLISTANATLSLKYEVKEVVKVDIAKKSDLDAMKSDVDSLKVIKGAILRTTSGYLREIVCDDNGLNLRTKSLYPERMLCLGNSITASVPLPNIWWGTWGMAASQKSKDWVRVLEARLKMLNPNHTAVAKSISNWEVNHLTYPLTDYDSYFDFNPDLIVIRTGENSNANIDQLGASYERLIDYIRSKAPTAKIVATGSFWTAPEKEAQMMSAFTNKNVRYVKIDDFFNSGHISFVGAVVKGDDGLDHVINDNGVAMHPNDVGMAKIADRIYSALV